MNDIFFWGPVVVTLVILFLIRDFCCWFFKTNRIVEKIPADLSPEIEEIKESLEIIQEHIEKIYNAVVKED